MKKLYILLITLAPLAAVAQDIPVYSQKLTNSFMYNPAIAGHTVGSATYSFRQLYGSIPNAPQSHFISVHTPLAGHRFGIGANYYQEEVNFLKNSYASAAFAYHIPLNRTDVLSFGVSGEYNFLRLSGTTNSSVVDEDYQKLLNGDVNDIDFSFGMLYQNQYVKVGLAANRLATAWIKEDKATVLTSYYSGFVQGMIPLRGGSDLLEPYVAYRKLSETNNTLDLGLYYTYNNKLMGGASWRKGNVTSLTAGFYITPMLMLGYSREMFIGDFSKQLGASNEFTLRFNFSEYSYKNTYSASYKSALAYRRKTLSVGSKGSRSPAQLHRKQKSLKQYSPNKRYQTTKKNSITSSSSKSLSKKPVSKRKPAKRKPPRRR